MTGFTVVFANGKSGSSLWKTEREARAHAMAANQRDGFTGPKAVAVRAVFKGVWLKDIEL